MTAPDTRGALSGSPTVDLADADPLAIAIAALRSSPALAAAFTALGAVSTDPERPAAGVTDRVLGQARPPWPMLQVTAGAGGGTGLLRFHVRSEVILSVWGDPGRSTSSEDLRRLLWTAVRELAGLPDAPHDPARPTVVDVRLTVPVQPLDDPSGALRWLAAVEITAHPPRT